MAEKINGLMPLSQVVKNFETNYNKLKEKLYLTGELETACWLAFESLKVTYDCKDPRWRKIRDKIYVSFIKETKSPKIMNTSVTSGVVVQLKDKPETVCVLNCGTGGIRYVFYQIVDGIVVVICEIKPSDNYSVSDLNVPGVYQGKYDAEYIKKSIARDLEDCKSKMSPDKLKNCKYIAVITGDIRAARDNNKGYTDEQYQKRVTQFDSVAESIFKPLNIETWNGKSYYLKSSEEGSCEVLATQNLFAGLDPKLKVLISFGIGRGSVQWTHPKTFVGIDDGMNRPDKMMALKKVLEKKFEEPDYVSVLLDGINDDTLPVIALKSGTLILYGRDKEIQKSIGVVL